MLQSLLFTLWLLLSLRSLPYLALVAQVPFSSSLAPSVAPHRFLAHSLPILSFAGSSSSLPPVLRAPPVSSASSVSVCLLSSVSGGRGGSGVAPVFGAVPVSRIISSPFSATSVFRLFTGGPPLPWWFLQLLSLPLSFPPRLLHWFIRVLLRHLLLLLLLVFWFLPRCSRWVPWDTAPAALLHDEVSLVPVAVLGSVRSGSRRMLAFLMDRFPQAADVHSAPPSLLSSGLGPWRSTWSFFCYWFSPGLFSFFGLGLLLLPPCNSAYAVRGVFALGRSVPDFSSLFSPFVKQLIPSFLFGLFVPAAAALAASLLSRSETILPFLVGPFRDC